MRAIIIEEERFTEFTLLLEAKAAHVRSSMHREMISIDVLKKHGVSVTIDGRDNNVIPQALVDAVVAEVQRSMHYEFVTWAQSHGASCVKR